MAESHPGMMPIQPEQEPSQKTRRGIDRVGAAISSPYVIQCIPGREAGPRPGSSFLDLEPLDLLFDAVGDEFLDAAVPGSKGLPLRTVEQRGIDLTFTTTGSPVCESISHVERTFFPTICGGAGKLNSARIDGARSTSDGESPRTVRLQKSTPGTSSASAQWSADQARSLSSRNSSLNSPRVVAHEQALAAVIPDDRVRRQRSCIALIDLVRTIDPADHRLPARVGHGLEPLDQLGQ